MAESVGTVDCPCCDLAVPTDRALDLETPYGTVSVCVACHPHGLTVRREQLAGGE